jgi:hypothetical protein
MNTQNTLSVAQIEAFYHDEFVKDQVGHFVKLFGAQSGGRHVTDMGGGCGFFAQSLVGQTDYAVKVIDMDPASIMACKNANIDAVQGDAIKPTISGNEDIVCFNLILHHLVADTEHDTTALQSNALAAWLPQAKAVFVNEYIYESYITNLSGWLIFQITKSSALSAIGSLVSKIIPSLKANTFGVGVRFRSHDEWQKIFNAIGFTVKQTVIGADEPVSLARRILFIKTIRRDSFMLVPSPLTSA